ncbi:MAG: hypothetical protein K9J79_07650 [Desulfobacteraceae bacterium]|nr:hypothetical protein [Desulfobacteraceae bacterium]
MQKKSQSGWICAGIGITVILVARQVNELAAFEKVSRSPFYHFNPYKFAELVKTVIVSYMHHGSFNLKFEGWG